MIWTARSRTFDLSNRGLIMGVLNVTPDSFSDGGRYADCGAAVARGLEIESEGADIIDIGGESTRPGAEEVPAEEELRRVIPVIRSLRPRTRAAISIDTRKAEVARAALAEGADIINDISALRDDPGMAGLAAESGAGVILMHMQGRPRTMQLNPHYDDVVTEVGRFLDHMARQAMQAGVRREAIALDPGIGFGKTAEHNVSLLRNLSLLTGSGFPLVLGVSRKSILGALLGRGDMSERHWPTVALTSAGWELGARIFRVHDVRENVHALRMTEAILGA